MKRWILNWGWLALYAVVLAVSVWIITLNSPEPIEETQTEKITLTFRHFWIKEHDRNMLNIFEDVVDSFQQSHPNIKVNFEGMDQTVHREQKLKSEMVTGTPPDMFVLFAGAEIEPYVRSNRLMDLTDYINTNQLAGKFRNLDAWTYDGKVYGLPVEGNAEPLFYNRDIFEKLGIEPPKTIAELDEAVRTLKANGIIPFALGNKERWPAAIFAHYLMDRYAGSNLINELTRGNSTASFNNSAYLQALVHFKDWVIEGAFSDPANDLSTEDAIDLFTSGQAAMYLNGSWDINLFHSASGGKDFPERVGVMSFPTEKQGQQAALAGGYTIGIALSANLEDAKREAALELLHAFYTEEVQRRIVYEGQRIPSMDITFDAEKTGPVFEQVLGLIEQSNHIFLPYDNAMSPEVSQTFLKVIGELITGSVLPAEGLDEIQSTSEQYWQLRGSSKSD